MRRMLASRISRRTLVKHHIALSNTLADRDTDKQSHVGIIYTNLSVQDSIQRCFDRLKARPYKEWASFMPKHTDEPASDIRWPGKLLIDGHVSTKFSYIRVRSLIPQLKWLLTLLKQDHLDYIVLSLLKNVSIRVLTAHIYASISFTCSPCCQHGLMLALVSHLLSEPQ
jgi:pyruvate dehydrogenase kinase 2/3/4